MLGRRVVVGLLILLHPLHGSSDAREDVLMQHVNRLSEGPVLHLHHRHALLQDAWGAWCTTM